MATTLRGICLGLVLAGACRGAGGDVRRGPAPTARVESTSEPEPVAGFDDGPGGPSSSAGAVLELPDERRRIRCHVHGEALKEELVPIVYGRLMPDEAFSAAHDATFPNASTFLSAGCIVERYTKARVRHCPRCREARARWLKDHPEVSALGTRR